MRIIVKRCPTCHKKYNAALTECSYCRRKNRVRNIWAIGLSVPVAFLVIVGHFYGGIPKPDSSLVGQYSIKSIVPYHIIGAKRYQVRASVALDMPYANLVPTIQAIALDAYHQKPDARIVGVFVMLDCDTIARAELSIDGRDWAGDKVAPSWTVETMPSECWPLKAETVKAVKFRCANPSATAPHGWVTDMACIWKKFETKHVIK